MLPILVRMHSDTAHGRAQHGRVQKRRSVDLDDHTKAAMIELKTVDTNR